MIDHDLNCASHGPDGAVCQKIRGHIGNHSGVDTRGAERDWQPLVTIEQATVALGLSRLATYRAALAARAARDARDGDL